MVVPARGWVAATQDAAWAFVVGSVHRDRGVNMTDRQAARLRSLEGCHVSVALSDGSRIDDCQLVSAGRGKLRQLWLYDNLADIFVEHETVLDVWEALAS